jgi:hypothetical protein
MMVVTAQSGRYGSRAQLVVMGMLLVLLSACRPPDSAYENRGGPESLIDVSSEIVNLTVASGAEIDDLSAWIDRDQPTRAELYCLEGDPICVQARQVLDLYGVPTQFINSSTATVTLIYERILARDCDQRYVKNQSLTNVSSPSFGCSLAANMVQQITNKQQIVRQNLMDYPDAAKAVQVHDNYRLPPVVGEPLTIQDSAVGDAIN